MSNHHKRVRVSCHVCRVVPLVVSCRVRAEQHKGKRTISFKAVGLGLAPVALAHDLRRDEPRCRARNQEMRCKMKRSRKTLIRAIVWAVAVRVPTF